MDSVLAAKARSLANLVEEENGKIHIEFSDDNMPDLISDKSVQLFEVWLPDGSVLARSKALGTRDLPRSSGTAVKPAYDYFQQDDGLKARVVSFQFDPIIEVGENRYNGTPQSRKATISISQDMGDLNSILAKLATLLVIGALMIPLISAVVVSVAVKRGLRPLKDLAGEVRQIDAASLETRVQAGSDIVELQPISTTLNDLLVRLNVAFLREKRFTTDASHELRTPLAEARTALEIALKWPDDTALLQQSAQQALDSTQHMEAMVIALLTLARAESDRISGPREIVDLEDLTLRCWRQLHESADRNSLTLSLTAPDRKAVNTSRALVTAIITNLLTNAVQYATPGSAIHGLIAMNSNDSAVIFKLTNAVSTEFDSDDFEHLFEPLWRKDNSRTEDLAGSDAHFGLGLALVKAYCDNLRIPICAYPEDQRFAIELRFPV